MAKSAMALQVVPASILGYALLYQTLVRGAEQSSYQAKLKALSAGHATVATVLVLYALTTSPLRSSGNSITSREPKYASIDNLDDSENPLIQERSSFANAITAWETGYMLYDTWAMVHSAQSSSSLLAFVDSTVGVARRQPALFGHHIALSCALLTLQRYIYVGRERGIWVILAFMLMNASNPLMHARWWARRKGRSSKSLDAAFATVFAISRFGTVAWVLRVYGAYHGLNPWEAYKRLRAPCQMGTGALVGLNALWWLTLINGMIRRNFKHSSESGVKRR